MKRYAVVFEKAKNNWGAYIPDLPGCVATGRPLEETRNDAGVLKAIPFGRRTVASAGPGSENR